jgi:DNA-binding response OmpR family regulator
VEKVKVLIVDDMLLMREILKESMQVIYPNIETVEVGNGWEAYEQLNKIHYDLVLCDWELPDMKGIELLKWLRNHPTLKETPVIIITAKEDNQIFIEAEQSGVTDLIIKPFHIDVLRKKVLPVLEKIDGKDGDPSS